MYGTVAQLRRYLNQVPAGSAQDVLLAEVMDRASSMVDLILGYGFGSAVIGPEVVYGDGTSILLLPVHTAGSVTAVTSISSVTVPAYIEEGQALRVVDSSGRKPVYPRPAHRYAWPTGYEDDVTNGAVVLFGGLYAGNYWRAGVPYTVTATWGHAITPPDIVEATLEIAAAIHKEKDAGFATVIGEAAGGMINIRNALPLKAKAILDARAAPNRSGGVY